MQDAIQSVANSVKTNGRMKGMKILKLSDLTTLSVEPG
jgi:hypothetical protein